MFTCMAIVVPLIIAVAEVENVAHPMIVRVAAENVVRLMIVQAVVENAGLLMIAPVAAESVAPLTTVRVAVDDVVHPILAQAVDFNYMLSDILSIYQKDDKYLVLNSQVPAWVVTNLTGLAALKLYCENKSFEFTAEFISHKNKGIQKKSIIDFLKSAEKESLFCEDVFEHIHHPYFLSNIYLNMTQKCNLHCIYCYASARKEHGKSNLEYDDYVHFLDDAKKISAELNITFTGGEPLLSENTLPVAKYAKSLGMGTKILTNATLITEKNVKDICKVFKHFQISMDGSTSALHNHYRGKDSFEKTVKAIELLKSNDVDVKIAMTLTKENSFDVNAMNEKWGGYLTFQPLFPMGRAENDKNVLSGLEYYDVLTSNEKISPFSDINGIIQAHRENRTIHKCAMGDGEISISCTGDVYPCQLLHFDEFYLGNIRESSLEEIYNSEKNNKFKTHTVDCIEKCKSCDFRYLWGGACQARHFSETGSIDKAGDFCEYEKKGIIEGLINSCEMTDV